MKHKGSISDYVEERNAKLQEIFRREFFNKEHATTEDVIAYVSQCGAPRFYVSEQRARAVLRKRRRTGEWPEMQDRRRSMFEELWERYKKMEIECPGEREEDIIFAIVNSPAPSFYLSPKSVRTLIYAELGVRCQ